jgi:hypothetical protein
MIRKAVGAFTTMALVLAGLVITTPGVAHASTCVIEPKRNEWSGNPHLRTTLRVTYHGGQVVREFCFRLGVNGHPGRYRFEAQVQELVDTAADGSNDDSGCVFLRWDTPGNPVVWNEIARDCNSANFAVDDWASPWLHSITNGVPLVFRFRFSISTFDGGHRHSQSDSEFAVNY